MSLSIPGSFPAASRSADNDRIDRTDRPAENAPAVAEQRPPSGSDAAPDGRGPLARVNTARDATLQKKLLRAVQGNLAISLPATAVAITTSAATAAVMRENLADNAAQAAIAGGVELAAGLGVGVVTTAMSHHGGLMLRIWPPASEQEVLDRTFLIAAVMNAGHSIIGGLAYDLAAKAMMHQDITREKLLESVIDQVIGKFVATGVIGAGAGLMYKHNQRFRSMVDGTLSSMLEEIRRRTGPRAHTMPEIPEAAMEEGRLSAESMRDEASHRQPMPSAAPRAETGPQDEAVRSDPDNRPS